MKKIGLFLVAAFAAISLSSCNDTEGDYPGYLNFVTVRTMLGSTNFFFETDNGKTIYPGDVSRIGAYEAKDGQRAVITFNLLAKMEGYDYNARLYNIGNIYTGKASVVSTQEALDAIKDHKILLGDALLSKNYLTLIVAYPVNDNTKHTFDLIVNKVKPSETNAGYLDVELRHNDGGETIGATRKYYISFDLADIQTNLKDMKGITIRSLQEEVKYNKIDFQTFDE